MTPMSPSIAAGSDLRRALLASWLRRAASHPRASDLVLRGSLVLGSFCPARARPAADVDYLVIGDLDFAAIADLAHAIAAAPDERGALLAIDTIETIWAETAFPGLRAHVVRRDAASNGFHVDFAIGDPLSLPPRLVILEDVGPVLGCAPETLFAWKLHGLVEFGRGRWRPKDLYDLDVLWSSVPMDLHALRPAIDLAFSSRALPVDALHDFRVRSTWGTSRGGARKWRSLRANVPSSIALDDFLEVRARVRAAIDVILGA